MSAARPIAALSSSVAVTTGTVRADGPRDVGGGTEVKPEDALRLG